MAKPHDTFWQLTDTYVPVERRILFSFGKKVGEVVLSIAPDQSVVDVATMSETMLQAARVEASQLKSGESIAPQIVFATIAKGHHGQTPVAMTAAHREMPVWQLTDHTDAVIDDLSFDTYMKAARTAMPTAAVAPSDHAIGFLVKDTVLHFYPVLAVSLPDDIESYHEGSGTTSDFIPLLPFQS